MSNPVAHQFVFDLEISTSSADGTKAFRCVHCKVWTADTQPFIRVTCPKRDRRSGDRRHGHDRRGFKRTSSDCEETR
jgi:hypothetical protein